MNESLGLVGYKCQVESHDLFFRSRVYSGAWFASVPVVKMKGLLATAIENVFDSGNEVLIVIGMPNVATVIPSVDRTGYEKFSAFSLGRKAAAVVNITRPDGSFIQSGIWIRLKGLSEEQIERIRVSMHKFEGMLSRTCVNANFQMMLDAGFEFPGVKGFMANTFPISFLEGILKGIFLDGMRVEFEVVKTTELRLASYAKRVMLAEALAPFRHGEELPVVGKLASAVVAVAAKVAPPETERRSVVAPVPESTGVTERFELYRTNPRFLGMIGRWICGPHPLYKVRTKLQAMDYFDQALKPFPQQNPDLLTKVKKHFLFSWISVTVLRWLIGFDRWERVGEFSSVELLRRLKTVQDSQTKVNYNYVAHSEEDGTISVVIAQIAVKFGLIDWILSKHVLIAGYMDEYKDIGLALGKRKFLTAGDLGRNAEGYAEYTRNSGTTQPTEKQNIQFLPVAKRIFGDYVSISNS